MFLSRSSLGRAGVAAIVLWGANGRPREELPAIQYTLTYDAHLGSDSPVAARIQWTADVVCLPSRGRMDIIAGSASGLFGTGDYVLFDSSGAVVANTREHTIAAIPRSAQMPTTRMFAKNSIRGLKWSIDTLPERDTVAGYPTMHVRLNVTYSRELSGEGVSADPQLYVPPPVVTTTNDYWIALVNGLPANAIAPYAGSSVDPLRDSSALSEVWLRVADVLKRSGAVLRVTTATNTRVGDRVVSANSRAVVTNIHKVEASASSFSIPDAFRPEGGLARDASRVTHWRASPEP